MRTTTLVCVLICHTTLAFAIADDSENSLGAYFDVPTCNCVGPEGGVPIGIPTEVTLYFVLANPTVASLGGFEFAWTFYGAPVTYDILETTLPPDSMNIGTSTSFVVGMAQPLLTSEATLLTALRLVITRSISDRTYISVGPSTPPSHPGYMSFVSYDDPATIRHMGCHHISEFYPHLDNDGWLRPGVGWLHGCWPPPVSSEDVTWSRLKAVFQ